MGYRTGLTLIVCILLLVLGACQNVREQETQDSQKADGAKPGEENYLFENDNVRVKQTSGWQEQDSSSKYAKENIMFQNGKLKAILTFVSKDKSLESIKSELKLSFGDTEIVKENENYIALLSNRKERIRTDIYFNVTNEEENIGILIFMVPSGAYETNQAKIEAFKNSVQYL